jgi:AcrR family transcriptional regulator
MADIDLQPPRPVTRRLSPTQRRRILLERATVFFAENGMSAPTRALAEACGVAQRLLYRYFPSKSALLAEVTEQAIVAPFKAIWLVRLSDRNASIQQRLCVFYADYYATVLSRQWIRLFLFGGLDGSGMAPAYIDSIIKQLLEVIVREAAVAQGLELPRYGEMLHEIGWVLHGAVSHLAIRQHVYGASQSVRLDDVLALHVAAFLAGLPAACAEARAREARPTGARQIGARQIGARQIEAGTKSSVYD